MDTRLRWVFDILLILTIAFNGVALLHWKERVDKLEMLHGLPTGGTAKHTYTAVR